MKKRRISIKEIAELAGTSVATVSRVINQNGRFSKETEQKVRSIMEEYGYEQNKLAHGLRAQNTHTIGILVPDIGNEFYASITKVVQQKLLERNYFSLICNTQESEDNIRKYSHILRGLMVDGIIYIGNIELAEAINMPTVYIDRDPRDQEFIADDKYIMVECDNINGGYLAGKELSSKGVKTPCFVAYNLDITNHKKRLQGFRMALHENGILIEKEHILSVSKLTFSDGFAIMKQIVETMPEIDGIFFASDLLALGALSYANQNGIKIPDQIRIMGFDNISGSALFHPALTTIHQPIEEMGTLAVECITDKIHGEKIKQQRMRLPVTLIQRETT